MSKFTYLFINGNENGNENESVYEILNATRGHIMCPFCENLLFIGDSMMNDQETNGHIFSENDENNNTCVECEKCNIVFVLCLTLQQLCNLIKNNKSNMNVCCQPSSYGKELSNNTSVYKVSLLKINKVGIDVSKSENKNDDIIYETTENNYNIGLHYVADSLYYQGTCLNCLAEYISECNTK